jgi:thioredoxin-related protein
MRFKILLIIFATIFLNAEFNIDNLPKYSIEYNPKSNPNIELEKALKVAKQKNKNILLVVGGNWCRWCGTFDNFLDDHPKVAKKFYNSFEVVRVYFGKNMTKETKEFLMQLPPIKGTPHFYILNSNAKLLKSVDTSFLERGYGYNRKKVIKWIDENKNLSIANKKRIKGEKNEKNI